MTLARLSAVLLAATTATTAGATPARADSKPLLIESYVGARPPNAERAVAKLLRAMGDGAVRHGEKLAAAIGDKLSRSAGPIKIGANARARVQEGRRQFIVGNYGKAITVLEAARRELLAHTGTVASNQSYRQSFLQALLYLAHAYLKVGKPPLARARVTEAIRSFSERTPSPSNHSPDLLRFYRQVRSTLDQQKRGTLAVKTTPPGLAVFVNEQYRFVSPSSVADLHPGTYRVYAQRGGRRGRVHSVRVTAGGDVSASIDFTFDSALTTDAYVGLRYTSGAEQKKLAATHAAKVGRTLDADSVLVIGVETHQGRRALRGSVIRSGNAQLVRSGMIVIGAASSTTASFDALARFLLAGQRAPGRVIVLKSRGAAGTSGDGAGGNAGGGNAGGGRDGDDGGGFFSARVFKWITGALALAAAGASVPMFVLDGKGTCDSPAGVACPESYETLVPGIVLAGAGGALLATSIVLFVIDAKRERRARQRSVSLAPWLGAGTVGLSGRMRF